MQPRTITLALLVLLFFTSGVMAQQPGGDGYEPVDPTIGDTDPLRRSLRRVDEGLGRTSGQESRVLRRSDGTGHLYYTAPGLTASFRRSDYGWFKVSKDREQLFQLIPPGTVFHLSLPPVEESQELEEGVKENEMRSEGRVDASVDTAVRDETWRADPEREVRPEASVWRDYKIFARAQRQAVMESLERIDEADTPAVPAEPIEPAPAETPAPEPDVGATPG